MKTKPRKKWSEMTRKEKLGGIVGAVIICLFIGVLLGSLGSNDSSKLQEKTKVETVDTSNLSPEKIIETKVRASVQKTTNTKKDKIREVQVNSQVDGGWGVLVHFNANDNLSDNLIKAGIWDDMGAIYKTLFKENPDVERATLFAHFDTTDKYGKTTDSIVLKTSLEKSEAEKVNWNLDEPYLFLSVLPEVWTTSLNHFK